MKYTMSRCYLSVIPVILSVLALAACGGGGVAIEQDDYSNSHGTHEEQGINYLAELQVQQDVHVVVMPGMPSQRYPDLRFGFSTDSQASEIAMGETRVESVTNSPRATETILAATNATGDATSPTAVLGGSAAMINLAFVGSPSATTVGVGPTVNCAVGYMPPPSLIKAQPAVLPTNGGLFYTTAELSKWRARVVSGPFINANDYIAGSPGEWSRIEANAARFLAGGEHVMSAQSPVSDRTAAGSLARDAAFVALIRGDNFASDAVRAYVVAEAINPANNFATLCMRNLNGSAVDAWFFHASWLLRYMATYDFIRARFTSSERVTIENAIRRNAHFLAANNDWGMSSVFPARLTGDYFHRAGAAAATTDAAKYWNRRFDSNGDCKIDSSDDPTAYPTYAYVRADGSLGPRLTVLSQYFNNRRSVAAAAFGIAGVLTSSPELIITGKRYFMEWLTYGVWADGSQGEFARNGDYCIPQQGIVYAYANIQGASLLARVLARQGDTALFAYTTSGGLFGTESLAIPKSLSTVAAMHVGLLRNNLLWYFHENWRTPQQINQGNYLGNNVTHYMKSATATDNYHELGLLPVASRFGGLPLASIIMRDPVVTKLRFPGTSGNQVSTGYGVWSDAFNVMPSILLIRP